jgi:NAD(P)-dependent dehydrogenase (short-subunit alcohol dehydrogenase family)
MSIEVHYAFNDATVLVTGAGSGIGAALSAHCARAGSRVIAVDVNHGPLNELMSNDPNVDKIDRRVVDVADDGQVAALFESLRKSYDGLDAAVLGAAIQKRIEIDDMTQAEWRETMDINLSGIFACLKGVVPWLKAQRRGAIVTFTSGLATVGWPGAGAYAASKAAMIGLTKSLAQELRSSNVRANVLSPGVTATPIFLDVAEEQERQMYETGIGVYPPDSVVPTLLYLISDASWNMTGTVIEHRIRPAGPRPGQ